MGPGEALMLDAFTIATPSALDAAFRMGIPVHREGERPPRPLSGEQPGLWQRILENDATYVIQVVGGRAQVSQITESGPVPFGTDSVQEHNK